MWCLEMPFIFKVSCLISLLVCAPLAAAQLDTAPAAPESNSQMQIPPPVSSIGLPTTTGELEMSNYFRGSLVFSGGYVNNLYPGSGARTVDDTTFSVQPRISLDRSTDRIHVGLQYEPTFDYYDPDGSLNTINHTGAVAFQYRFSPNATLLAGDTVAKTSNTWSQPVSSGSVSGSLPPASPGFIAPFVPQISNSAYVQLTLQYSQSNMIGFGGNSTILDFFKPSQAQGLYNSDSRSGSVFYTVRWGQRQYAGALYDYSLILATPVTSTGVAQADLTAHNILGFYTVYLQPTLSISFGAGSQYYDVTQSSSLSAHAWTPIAVGSLGWQVLHASFSLNYSRVVTEGEGTIGAYASNSGSLSAQLQPAPNWTASVSGNYSQLDPVAHAFAGSLPAGHTLSFQGSLERQLGPFLTLSVQYQRLHQTYIGIPSISTDPNSSRATASISYHFSRPLGR